MPSKDQRSIDEPSSHEKWDRAKSLFLESLHKADPDLRGCAHNQHCYDELMQIRDDIIKLVEKMVNPIPLVETGIPGKLPDEPPKVESYVKSKSYEYAADITMSDIRRFQRGNLL